jgi:hypothetical protein
MKRPKIDPNTLLAGIGLVLLSLGLAVGLPPAALYGPGAALAVPGCLLIVYAVLPDRTGGPPAA